MAHSTVVHSGALVTFEVVSNCVDILIMYKWKLASKERLKQEWMQMYLKTHSSSVCIWIFLALLHPVTSRHGQQTLTLFHQNAEEKNLKVKVKESLEAENDQKLQDVNSCDCRDYCPDPNSTELQVSFRWKFYDKR